MGTYNDTLETIAAGATPWKIAVRVVATSNITLLGLQTLDGVTVEEGDRVLVVGQTNAAENGIYLASVGAWARAVDMRTGTYTKLGTTVRVMQGGRGTWMLTSPTNGSVRVGVSELVFQVDTGAGPTGDYSSTWTIDRSKRIVAEADAYGMIRPVLAASGHRAGATLQCTIAAGEVAADTDLVLPTDIDPEGNFDPFDASAYYVITVQCTDETGAGKFVASGVRQERTTAAPAIVSAVVAAANPNALVVTWSAPVDVPALTGIAFGTFSSGTTRTITAIEGPTSADCTEWTFTLSGDFDGTEVVDLVVGSTRTARAQNGTLIAAETEAVNVAFAASWVMPNQENMWRGDQITGSVASVIDQTGSDDMLTPGSDLAAVANIGGTSRAGFKPTGAGSYLEADFASRAMTGGYCIYYVARIPTHTTISYVASGQAAAPTTFEAILFEVGATLTGTRSNAQAANVTAGYTTTVLHDVMYQVDPGGINARLYIDGALVDTETTDESTANISRWTIGALPGHTLPATDVEYGEVRIGRGTTYSGADATAGHDYRLAYYV